jgi:hypothetical protein
MDALPARLEPAVGGEPPEDPHVAEGEDEALHPQRLQALGGDRQDLDVGCTPVPTQVLEAHLEELALPPRLRWLVPQDLPRVVEPDGRGAPRETSRRDLREKAREVGPQGQQAPVAAHEGVGPALEGRPREHVGVVVEGWDDLLVVPALEDRDHEPLDGPAAAGLLPHEALHAGGHLNEPVGSEAHLDPTPRTWRTGCGPSTCRVRPSP